VEYKGFSASDLSSHLEQQIESVKIDGKQSQLFLLSVKTINAAKPSNVTKGTKQTDSETAEPPQALTLSS